ncbi:MAG: hypothetical protein H7301_03085 [Cryobacterium sp.]|nr:hypothetical protein [Oligoflexia bacterium]
MTRTLKTIHITEIEIITGLDRETIALFITREWIRPYSDDLLDEEDVARIRLIQDLKNQFNANDDSIPIILHLMDQLYALRNRVSCEDEINPFLRLSQGKN